MIKFFKYFFKSRWFFYGVGYILAYLYSILWATGGRFWPDLNPKELDNIKATWWFWFALIIPSLVFGETTRHFLFRKFKKIFKEPDPLDLVINERKHNSKTDK